MKFELGQIVLVHQGAGGQIIDGRLVLNEHECARHEHWYSRVVGWNEYQGMPTIATRCRGERGNPCHAEWTYPESSLEAAPDAEDWTDGSAWCEGMDVRIVLDDDIPQFPKGTVLNARIETAHIEPEDWYVSFEVPNRGHTPTTDTWRFHRVVNERDFVL